MQLGVCWDATAWADGSWVEGAWCPEAECTPASIGECWAVAWCSGAWQSGAWCPPQAPAGGGTLPRYSTTGTVDITPRRRRVNPLDVLRREDEEIIIL